MILGWMQVEGESAEFVSHVNTEPLDYLSVPPPSRPPTDNDFVHSVFVPDATAASSNCWCVCETRQTQVHHEFYTIQTVKGTAS